MVVNRCAGAAPKDDDGVASVGRSSVGKVVSARETITALDSESSIKRRVLAPVPELSDVELENLRVLIANQSSRNRGLPSSLRVVGRVEEYDFCGGQDSSASNVALVNAELREIRRELLLAQGVLGPDMEVWPSEGELMSRWQSAVTKVRIKARDRLAFVGSELAARIIDVVVPVNLHPQWTVVSSK